MFGNDEKQDSGPFGGLELDIVRKRVATGLAQVFGQDTAGGVDISGLDGRVPGTDGSGGSLARTIAQGGADMVMWKGFEAQTTQAAEKHVAALDITRAERER